MKLHHPSNTGYFITPYYYSSRSNRYAQVLDPATHEYLGTIPLCAQTEVQAAIAAASDAYQEWRQCSANHRAEQLQILAGSIERSIERNLEIARLLSRETGTPLSRAINELAQCPQILRRYAQQVEEHAVSGHSTAQQSVLYEPYGVSVHILSSNSAILLMCQTVAAALAAGNSCIIKPAQSATLCSLKFSEHFNALLPGLVCCVPGDASTAQLLVQSPSTQVVAFTGSVAAGNAVAVTCAELMKPCLLETDGSSSLIVSTHSPLEIAAAYAAQATFHFKREKQHSVQRLFVVDEVHDHFVDLCLEHLEKLRLAQHLGEIQMTPLSGETAHNKVIRLICDASTKGATLICGGRVPSEQPIGWFYEPTIITGVNNEMAILHEVCPGPVTAIVRARDFSHALQLANDSSPNAQSSLFSSDIKEVIAASEQLEANTLWINPPPFNEQKPSSSALSLSGPDNSFRRSGLDVFRRTKRLIVHVPHET
ncbi:aldehyde dehydrogenase family protein [Pseudomonas sp. TNT2022 ID357]|uniref:Aldehyde dehydrogenase family protein n=1 Tax=Pseudomonas idahonensis TaxID=2942628 RepID=A0ABT5Q639_9PSED|nr:aldehyde dehydrogenase family protein [Pseudomonas idahonensis]MDD1149669.1 aldehyde dehydrogenase family protein [Pseudomonas idahonensis]